MNVEVMREAGIIEALLGLSLSYESEPNMTVANNLAHKQGGHNKFLESIVVWLDITAPRYWWQQFDTYRVGTTKQSGSTMHTIMRRPLTQSDFQGEIDERILDILNEAIEAKDFDKIKKNLPESFLQRRIVCTNYKVLQNMCKQRLTHKLPEWQQFIISVTLNVSMPRWIAER